MKEIADEVLKSMKENDEADDFSFLDDIGSDEDEENIIDEKKEVINKSSIDLFNKYTNRIKNE